MFGCGCWAQNGNEDLTGFACSISGAILDTFNYH